MEQKLATKGEVIMAGLGGGGILTSGTLLAQAASAHYKHVTWFPSYAISKRGGLCECTVIFSNDEVASPLLSHADGIIVAEAAQFKDFENRVRPGGTIIVESAGLEAKPERKDIRVIDVPAIQTAIGITGSSRGANLVLLGAFVEATKAISPELIKQELKKSFADNKRVLRDNIKSFEEGLNLAKKL
ncbi:MAG: 2-oxoacid:acceptor oxidoreductase family protein [Dehalococcoidia bacterium]|nr:2-oxoacid:acceptor oxidoreductase family protein [Dehalococcoidia bacterium]